MADDPIIVRVDDSPRGIRGNPLWQNGTVTQLTIQRVITCKTGKVACPVAGSETDPPVVLQLHSPIYHMHLVFDLERIGSTPLVPDWELDEPSLELEESDFSLFAPVPYDDQLFKHRASGHYRFAMKKAPSKEAGDYQTPHAVYWIQGKARFRASNFSKEFGKWT